ncbi:hypothetical protein G7Y79_00035g071480 [Physcia stellaris]|nr:hypothetical protein G7Y79_00035g071480 [Physcia stellaris]
MVPSIGPHSIASYNRSEPLQRNNLRAPQPDYPNRQLDSPLDPNAPVFVLPDVKPKQGPSREHLRSIMANTEEQRRTTLKDFTETGEWLKHSRRKLADLNELPDTKQHPEQHPEQLEQEFDDFAEILDRIGDTYKALCDEIEELWGALAMAPE